MSIESVEINNLTPNPQVDGTEGFHSQKTSDGKSYETTITQIKDYANSFVTPQIINTTYQLGSGGGSENYTVTASDSGKYIKGFNTNNHTIILNDSTLQDDINGWVVVNSNADGGLVQILFNETTTGNVKDIGEQISSNLSIETGGAVIIKRNTGTNFDIIGDITI